MLSIFPVKRTGAGAQSCSLLHFWGVCKWWTFSDPKGQRQCKKVLDHWAENCNPGLPETGPGCFPLMCFIINRKQSWLLPSTPRGCIPPHPSTPGGERSRVPPLLIFPLPEPGPCLAPLLRSPSWARRESCRHQPPAGRGRRIRDVAGMLSARKIPGRVLWAARCAVHFPGAFLPSARGTARGAPAAAPGRRRCLRCPAAFVRERRGGAGTRLLVFTADVFSLTQRLYSGWWPTAESVSRCYLHSLFYGGLKYLYSSNLYRADKINFFFSFPPFFFNNTIISFNNLPF